MPKSDKLLGSAKGNWVRSMTCVILKFRPDDLMGSSGFKTDETLERERCPESQGPVPFLHRQSQPIISFTNWSNGTLKLPGLVPHIFTRVLLQIALLWSLETFKNLFVDNFHICSHANIAFGWNSNSPSCMFMETNLSLLFHWVRQRNSWHRPLIPLITLVTLLLHDEFFRKNSSSSSNQTATQCSSWRLPSQTSTLGAASTILKETPYLVLWAQRAEHLLHRDHLLSSLSALPTFWSCRDADAPQRCFNPWSWDSGGRRRSEKCEKRLRSQAPFYSPCVRPGCLDLPWALTDLKPRCCPCTFPAGPGWLSEGFCTYRGNAEALMKQIADNFQHLDRKIGTTSLPPHCWKLPSKTWLSQACPRPALLPLHMHP